MQFIYLKDLMYQIECCSPSWGYNGNIIYLNTENGQFYKEDDMVKLISDELFSSFDFVLLPTVPIVEIKRNYLKKLTGKKFKHWENSKLESYFHGVIEEQYIEKISWRNYIDSHIRNIALEWCLENGILCTTKNDTLR